MRNYENEKPYFDFDLILSLAVYSWWQDEKNDQKLQISEKNSLVLPKWLLGGIKFQSRQTWIVQKNSFPKSNFWTFLKRFNNGKNMQFEKVRLVKYNRICLKFEIQVKCLNGLRHYIKIWRLPVQTSLGVWLMNATLWGSWSKLFQQNALTSFKEVRP